MIGPIGLIGHKKGGADLRRPFLYLAYPPIQTDLLDLQGAA
jgi:hypothetical protein